MSSPADQRRPAGAIKNPQDFGAGLFLIALAAVGFLGTLNLTFGQLSGVGAGMMPRTASILVAAFGVLLIVQALFTDGNLLDRWNIRGIFFVLGSALIFSWTIRPLGLAVAGPVSVIFCALADRESRPIELLVYAAVITVACIGLFHYVLGLPMPILPSSLPYPLDEIIGKVHR